MFPGTKLRVGLPIGLSLLWGPKLLLDSGATDRSFQAFLGTVSIRTQKGAHYSKVRLFTGAYLDQ